MTNARMPGQPGGTLKRYLLIGGALCIAVLLLAACGATTTAGLGSKNGQPTTTTTITATAVATASPTAALKIPSGVTSCGAVFSGAAGTTSANAHDIEGCFYTAYQSCHSAALLYTEFGVDTQTVYLFVVQPGGNGACGVSASIKYSSCCGGPGRTVVVTDTCAGVTQANGAYVIESCAHHGNIALP